MTISKIDWNDLQLKKISVRLGRHATSFSLEPPFIEILTNMAQERGISFAKLVQSIDVTRQSGVNLSSALRLYVLRHALESHEQPNRLLD